MISNLRNVALFQAYSTGRQIRFGVTVPDTLDRVAYIDRGERQLGIFVLPPFQRKSVWTRKQQTLLIESLWLGLPIAAYIFNQTDIAGETDMWLLDGQQRWTAILAYVNGDFDVMGFKFGDLSDVDQKSFKSMTFPCVQTNIRDSSVCEDVYNRLAYGGTNHDPD